MQAAPDFHEALVLPLDSPETLIRSFQVHGVKGLARRALNLFEAIAEGPLGSGRLLEAVQHAQGTGGALNTGCVALGLFLSPGRRGGVHRFGNRAGLFDELGQKRGQARVQLSGAPIQDLMHVAQNAHDRCRLHPLGSQLVAKPPEELLPRADHADARSPICLFLPKVLELADAVDGVDVKRSDAEGFHDSSRLAEMLEERIRSPLTEICERRLQLDRPRRVSTDDPLLHLAVVDVDRPEAHVFQGALQAGSRRLGFLDDGSPVLQHLRAGGVVAERFDQLAHAHVPKRLVAEPAADVLLALVDHRRGHGVHLAERRKAHPAEDGGFERHVGLASRLGPEGAGKDLPLQQHRPQVAFQQLPEGLASFLDGRRRMKDALLEPNLKVHAVLQQEGILVARITIRVEGRSPDTDGVLKPLLEELFEPAVHEGHEVMEVRVAGLVQLIHDALDLLHPPLDALEEVGTGLQLPQQLRDVQERRAQAGDLLFQRDGTLVHLNRPRPEGLGLGRLVVVPAQVERHERADLPRDEEGPLDVLPKQLGLGDEQRGDVELLAVGAGKPGRVDVRQAGVVVGLERGLQRHRDGISLLRSEGHRLYGRRDALLGLDLAKVPDFLEELHLALVEVDLQPATSVPASADEEHVPLSRLPGGLQVLLDPVVPRRQPVLEELPIVEKIGDVVELPRQLFPRRLETPFRPEDVLRAAHQRVELSFHLPRPQKLGGHGRQVSRRRGHAGTADRVGHGELLLQRLHRLPDALDKRRLVFCDRSPHAFAEEEWIEGVEGPEALLRAFCALEAVPHDLDQLVIHAADDAIVGRSSRGKAVVLRVQEAPAVPRAEHAEGLVDLVRPIYGVHLRLLLGLQHGYERAAQLLVLYPELVHLVEAVLQGLPRHASLRKLLLDAPALFASFGRQDVPERPKVPIPDHEDVQEPPVGLLEVAIRQPQDLALLVLRLDVQEEAERGALQQLGRSLRTIPGVLRQATRLVEDGRDAGRDLFQVRRRQEVVQPRPLRGRVGVLQRARDRGHGLVHVAQLAPAFAELLNHAAMPTRLGLKHPQRDKDGQRQELLLALREDLLDVPPELDLLKNGRGLQLHPTVQGQPRPQGFQGSLLRQREGRRDPSAALACRASVAQGDERSRPAVGTGKLSHDANHLLDLAAPSLRALRRELDELRVSDAGLQLQAFQANLGQLAIGEALRGRRGARVEAGLAHSLRPDGPKVLHHRRRRVDAHRGNVLPLAALQEGHVQLLHLLLHLLHRISAAGVRRSGVAAIRAQRAGAMAHRRQDRMAREVVHVVEEGLAGVALQAQHLHLLRDALAGHQRGARTALNDAQGGGLRVSGRLDSNRHRATSQSRDEQRGCRLLRKAVQSVPSGGQSAIEIHRVGEERGGRSAKESLQRLGLLGHGAAAAARAPRRLRGEVRSSFRGRGATVGEKSRRTYFGSPKQKKAREI
eukprot:scaffold602_cov298-Pinguiococcus_pyrenoidosus.AAC.9